MRLGRRFIYLAVILDAYTRAVRGWALAQPLTLDALDMALAKGTPFIFHSVKARSMPPGSIPSACWG
jgi:transposase InsO family protein